MRKTIILFLSLSLISCGSVLKGCFRAADGLLDEIGVALKSSPSSFEGNREIAQTIKSYDFDISRSRQFLESPEFRKAYKAPVERCDRLEWRQKIKEHLKALERESNQLEYIQKEMQDKVAKLFNKELLRVGPLKIELTTLDASVSLSIDTPCGTERYAKTLSDELDKEFKNVVLNGHQKDIVKTKLIYGTWREILKKSIDVIDIVIIGTTDYKENGIYESTGEMNVIYNKENALIFASSFESNGKWEIKDGKMFNTTTSINMFNTQDPAELFSELAQSLKDAEGDTDIYELLFLTSKVAILKFDFDGVVGTSKSIKIN